ncbi:MAG: quinone-dependent dihydroorotate dehydrogenase [Anaerolineales bacterium]
MYARLRPWLFHLDPERAHAATLRVLQLVGSLPPLTAVVRKIYATTIASPVELFGMKFSNRIGLAAGYDKDGLAWRGLACLGFGHIEVGTITPLPQPGNPRPRVFRLVGDQALINRLGFPSRGAAFLERRLRGRRPQGLVLGVNLGINKETPIETAVDDYKILMQTFSKLADYLTINVSSPNTPGLRHLQQAGMLSDLLGELNRSKTVPLLVKLSPDLTDTQLDEALDVLLQHGVDGVIATNTTTSRPPLVSYAAKETGGLSGTPLTTLSRRFVERIFAHTQGKMPIIAAGGILSRQDADAAIQAGASLVQVFTGLVYRGPGLVKELLTST